MRLTERDRSGTALVLAGLAILLALVYWPALSGPFVLDDEVNLALSRVGGWDAGEIRRATMANDSGPLGRPVAAFSFALNYLLFGDSTFAFKAVNLSLHMINAVLVYALARAALQIGSTGRSARSVRLVALGVALVWAFHPLHVSTVMYVVQRMMLLSTLFGMTALLAYVEARRRQIAGRPHAMRWFIAVPPLLLLSLLSKETGALVIVYLVAVESILFRFSLDGRVPDARLRAAVAALVGVGSAVALLALTLGGLVDGYRYRAFTLTERLLTEPGIVISYAMDLLLPRQGSMALYHDSWPVVRAPGVETAGAFGVILALVGVAVFCRHRAPVVSFGVALFLGSQLLESTALPLELRFEHRAYFGAVGLTLAVAAACVAGLPRFVPRAVAAVGICLVLGWQTHLRAWTWHDELALGAHEVAVHPESLRARSAFAISLSRADRPADALEQFDVAMRIDPDDTYLPLAALLVRDLSGSYDREKLEDALATLERGRVTLDTVNVLTDLVSNHRRGLLRDLQEPHLLAIAVRVANGLDHEVPPSAQAVALAHLSELFVGNGQHGDALRAIETAARFDPDSTELLLRRTELQAGLGQVEAVRAGISMLTARKLQDDTDRARLQAILDHLQASLAENRSPD